MKARSFVTRIDGRANNELRKVRIQPNYLAFAEGSVLIEVGLTRVLCAVSVEERVPNWMRSEKRGWITAEYSMLPRSTLTRTPRESTQGHQSGRTLEIQRLIGRSLRAVTDMEALGERTFTVDCDVLQADGGTRTASVTGAYVALYLALQGLVKKGLLYRVPLKTAVAATSMGVVEGDELLDLCYEEDFHAEVDFNVVMTADGRLVEVQGTAEQRPFSRQRMDSLLNLAEKGIKELLAIQRQGVDTLT